MPEYISQNGLGFWIMDEPTFGVTPATGERHDLPVSVGQGPLEATIAQIEDNTQRDNYETAVPTNGHASSSGTLDMSFRQCAGIDKLIEYAILGKFDENGLAFGGETEGSFTLGTRLTNKGGYMGYEDAGCRINSWSISGSAKEGVTTSFGVMGTKRTRKTADHAAQLIAAAGKAFNYKNLKNITIGGQTLGFTNFEFSTGNPLDHRVVFGEQEATSIATTGNRATTFSIAGYRKSFDIDALINGTPLEVKFSFIGEDGKGYRITLPVAVCTSPMDELTDTGLLVRLNFTAHVDETARAALIVEKLPLDTTP